MTRRRPEGAFGAADADKRDEHGHRWLATSSRILASSFPLVCGRCLIRADRPGADEPCDAAFEHIEGTVPHPDPIDHAGAARSRR